MKNKLWLGVGLLIIASLSLIVYGSKNSQISATTDGLLANSVSALDNTKGNPDASVTLVEYSDFECPACGAYAPVVKTLVEEYADRINFVYRHFPLPQHLSAKPAAYAAEAAGKQGKFFEMHDMIFADQSEWSTARNPEEIFAGYAEKLGLDMEQYAIDVLSDEVKNKVQADLQSGNQSGVRGTPTFYVNGKQIANPQTYEAFKAIIDDAITNS